MAVFCSQTEEVLRLRGKLRDTEAVSKGMTDEVEMHRIERTSLEMLNAELQRTRKELHDLRGRYERLKEETGKWKQKAFDLMSHGTETQNELQSGAARSAESEDDRTGHHHHHRHRHGGASAGDIGKSELSSANPTAEELKSIWNSSMVVYPSVPVPSAFTEEAAPSPSVFPGETPAEPSSSSLAAAAATSKEDPSAALEAQDRSHPPEKSLEKEISQKDDELSVLSRVGQGSRKRVEENRQKERRQRSERDGLNLSGSKMSSSSAPRFVSP